MDKLITVSLVYAENPTQQFLRTLEVPSGSTVQEVITLSGVCEAFPAMDLHQHQVGILSKVTALNVIVTAGDRVEIYRPLIFDPMNARRLRAKNQQSSPQPASGDLPQKIR